MKKQRKTSLHTRRNNITGYLFLSPWLFGFLVFTAFPFLYTFYLSFNTVQSTIIGYKITWVGFHNYNVIFFEIVEFVPALISFIIMQILYVPVILVISFILGLLLNQDLKFRAAFRTIFFLPVIILSGTVMQQFLSSGAISMTGISDILVFNIIQNYSRLLARAIEILFINFTIVLWFTGIPIILFINALQKIDRQLYEAAQIDGANWWQILWKITIPMIKSTALVVSIYTIINLGLYNINPLGDGKITVFDLIKNSLANSSKGLGVSAAYASVYSLVVLILVGLSMLIFRERDQVKKQETLKERQLKNLLRIQKKNAKRNMTVKEYFVNLKAKLMHKKEEKHEE